MHPSTRFLALVAVAALAACGGGSSTAPTITPVAKATAQAAATATARITLKFPKKAIAHKAGASLARSPQYFSASGQSIVVMVNGSVVGDPNNAFVPYFTWGSLNGDGTVTINVPIIPGSYASQSITFAEYSNADGTGNVLAYGYNGAYTDANGYYNDGSATVSAGSTANLVVTLAMNLNSLAITTDPVNGSDATVLDPNSTTTFCLPSGTLVYIVPTDASGAFVVPSQAGYTGGDQYQAIPGLPAITSYYINPGNGSTLRNAPFGGSAYIYQGSNAVYAGFQATNPLASLYPQPPFGYTYQVQGQVGLNQSC